MARLVRLQPRFLEPGGTPGLKMKTCRDISEIPAGNG